MKILGNQSYYTHKDNFYEWWYFDFVTDDGIFFNIVLHETDLFGSVYKPYYSLSCLINGKRYYFKQKKKLLIDKIGRYLNTKNGEISENRKSLNITLDFQKNTHLTINIDKKETISPLNKGVLYRSTLGCGMWKPNIIGEKFYGNIIIEGERRKVKGIVYQDHQWGDLPIDKHVKDWIWGHFDNNKCSIVFFKILTQTNKVIERYYILDRSEKVYSSGMLGIRTNILETFSGTKSITNKELELNIVIKKHLVETRISSSYLVRSHIKQNIDDKIYSYYRWSTNGWLDGSSCFGVVEYMRFR